MILRLAYIKFGNLNDLHRAIERIILNKLSPLYERKKSKGMNQSQEESKSVLKNNKLIFEDYIKDLKPLFDKHAQE